MKAFHKLGGSPVEVIVDPYSVEEAFVGKYFFGQTEVLEFGGGRHAWGGLSNPAGSGVDLFWNVYTISNFAKEPFTAEIWINTPLSKQGKSSVHVTSSNQAISPLPKPKIQLIYADRVPTAPTEGIFSFLRRVEPQTTLTRHDFQGLIILPPGDSVIVFLRSPSVRSARSRVAFGWWEEAKTR